MAAFLDTLRDGSWLTLSRAQLWALAVLVASAAGLVFLVATSDGLTDYQSRPLGTDFSNVYAAGTYVLEGRPAAPFDPRLQHAREREIFGDRTPFYGWHYPPLFLFAAAALALLPYQLALIVWQGATLGLYVLAIRSITLGALPSPLWGGSTREARRGGGGSENHHTTPTPHPSPQGGGELPSLWLLLALAFPPCS
jgi:hypothetical protein